MVENPPGSGVWYAQYFDAEGQRHREKVGRYDLACQIYYERKTAIREGRFKPPERATGLTFKALFEMACAERRHHLGARTYKEQLWQGGRLLEWFGTRPAAKISAEEIAERLGGLRDGGASASTANAHHALLSAVFKWGVLHKKLEHNPCRDVRRFHNDNARVRFLEAEEEASIRAVIRARYPECEAEFDLALHTGARRTELYCLLWEHVDLERDDLTIHGKAHANSGRTRVRHVPINSAAAEALRELHARSRGSAFVFPRGRLTHSSDGTVRSGAEREKRDRRQWFEECAEAAGVSNFRYHDLRHTFASRLRMKGVELADIMELLGHTSLQMVMRYAHLAPGRQRTNMELLVEEAPAAGRRRGPRPILQQTAASSAAGGAATRGEARQTAISSAIRSAIGAKKALKKATIVGVERLDNAKVS